GNHLGTTELTGLESPKTVGGPVFGQPQAKLHADVSPDGNLFAIVAPQGRKRLDVWSLQEGKHKIAWQPGEKDGEPIKWVGFVEPTRLLPLSDKGKLVLWDIEGPKAISSTTGVQNVLALNPTRKNLVVVGASAAEVIDLASFERIGQLAGPAPTGVFAACFRP